MFLATKKKLVAINLIVSMIMNDFAIALSFFLQEVLLHHPTEGPGFTLPQRMATCPARRHLEDVTAHV